MMTNHDPEGRIFYSTLTPIIDSFFAHHRFFILHFFIIYLFISFKKSPEYAKMQFHMITLLDVLGKIAW